MSLGVDCPKPGCGGYLTEKRSRRGKVFFGCSNYSKTKCDFVSWDRPLPQPCPKCGAKFVVQKVSKAGDAHPLPQRRVRLHAPTRKRTSRPPRPEGAPPAPTDVASPPPTGTETSRSRAKRESAAIGQRAPESGARARQRRDRLDVPRLREHVEGLHAQAACSRRRPASRRRAPASPGCTTRRRSCAARTAPSCARNASPQPLRGGSTMTAASAPANGTPANTALASAAMNSQFVRGRCGRRCRAPS